MFYAHIILAKKGPLARIWLAAHWDKKLTKAHVFETNIEKSVEGIMQPKVKLALRTSGHLLLGVVRIYSRKAKYLLADCNEAFVKIKMAFRPGMVDLPEGHREANVNAITLPEVFHDFDTALPELNDIDIEAQFSINQSRADEITLREDYGSLSLSLHDDGFGDVGFDTSPDMVRTDLEGGLNDHLFDNGLDTNVMENQENIVTLNDSGMANARLDGDGFGDEFGQPELFGDELFGDPPAHLENEQQPPKKPSAEIHNAGEDSDDGDTDHFDALVISPGSRNSQCRESPAIVDNIGNENLKGGDTENNLKPHADANDEQANVLISQEDEGFALAPVDAAAYKGAAKPKRKRKLIVDEVKNISGEEMKAQLANTSDIVTTLDLAPPTKRLMFWKETGGVEKLFSLPSRQIPARVLFFNYQRSLVSHMTSLEDFTCLGPPDILALDQINNENETSLLPCKKGRKRKMDMAPPTAVVNVQTATSTGTDNNEFNELMNSLAAPEPVRDPNMAGREGDEPATVADTLLNINADNVSGMVANVTAADNTGGQGPLLAVNDISTIGNLDNASHLDLMHANNNLPQHSNNHDLNDDFNRDDMTPVQHSEIEALESIPNLPVDQVSSILNAAENMPGNSMQKELTNIDKSHELATDWNDYAFPQSIELQHNADEQMENETSEQFEERVLNKRAAQLFYLVKNRMMKQEFLSLSELTMKNSRKQAAQKFYSLLVLKKFRVLSITQSAPYAEIMVSRGPSFDNPKL